MKKDETAEASIDHRVSRCVYQNTGMTFILHVRKRGKSLQKAHK
jgi:hypothetical protein